MIIDKISRMDDKGSRDSTDLNKGHSLEKDEEVNGSLKNYPTINNLTL